jgi:hypothetical protein
MGTAGYTSRMEQKAKPFVSKAQMKRAYGEFKAGKISYGELMKGVHATKDMQALPERVAEKKAVGKKFKTGVDLAL